MSSNPYSTTIQYLPIPPRVWSRVQNPCSVIAYKDSDPAANSDFAKADYEKQMLLKGNILQYKKNSSNLTKKQRYTQIAKGMWTNRTKTWATQSVTYTNPNMTSLLRVNYSVLDPSNNTFSSPPNPFGCPTNTIQDGGNLVCNVVVDPCTQEVVKRTQSQQLCNPTTDSDVPGRIQDLCWNDGTQTWYPRQRYIMPTSGSSWPEGYKGFVSALTPAAPVLTLVSIINDSVTLSWVVENSDCIPISSFYIYNNGILIQVVPYPSLTTTIYNLDNCSTNVFYVVSVSNTIESEQSNTVEAYINVLNGPTIESIESTCSGGIILTWSPPENICSDVLSYTIYQDNVPTYFNIQANETSYTITTGLDNCTTYIFYMTAMFYDGESQHSNDATTEQDPCPPVILASYTGNGQVTITLSVTTSICDILSYTIYQTDDLGVTVTYTNVTYSGVTSSYIINGLTNGDTYSFKAISVGLNNNSIESNTVTVILTLPEAPTITSIVPCYKQATISWTETSQSPPISSYTIYQVGGPTYTNVTSSYPVTGLINGEIYSFTVSATNSYGIESAQSGPADILMPKTSSYFTGTFTPTEDATNTYLKISTTTSLTYDLCDISASASVVLVGGGGGGGGGYTGFPPGLIQYYGGGGGGGGGVKSSSSLTISSGSTINVTIGAGGGGGDTGVTGGTGGTTTISGTSITTLNATGGNGGKGGLEGPTGGNNGGNGGNGDATGNGGKGGNGGDNGGNGTNGVDGSSVYSGGGGGGGSLTNGNGGGAGGNGTGGTGGGNTSDNGQAATAYGGGGGGGFGGVGGGGKGSGGFVQFTIPN